MRNLNNFRNWTLSILLALMLGMIVIPVTAQDDVPPSLKIERNQFEKINCEPSFITEFCNIVFKVDLLYETSVVPATIECGILWDGEKYDGIAKFETMDPSGLVTITGTSESKFGVSDEGLGDYYPRCSMIADDIHLVVWPQQPFAEWQIDADTIGSEEGEEEGEEKQDLTIAVESAFVDVLVGGNTADFTKEEVQSYVKGRGWCTNVISNPPIGDCLKVPAFELARTYLTDFGESIGLIDDLRRENVLAAEKVIGEASSYMGFQDSEGRPLFPAVLVGYENIQILATLGATTGPAFNEKAEQYLRLLAKMDIERGSKLVSGENN